MFIDLLEEIIPATDKFALVGSLGKVKLILAPSLLDVPEELFQNELTSSLSKDLLQCLIVVIPENVCYPKMTDGQLVEGRLDSEPP